MKDLRIKQTPGKSFIDLKATADDHIRENNLALSVHEWSGEGNKVCCIYLNIEQTNELYEYLKTFLEERSEALADHHREVKEKRLLLKRVYRESKDSGLVTGEQINSLGRIGVPIISLLAKDLQVPANEILTIVESGPLPFALLNKHFRACWESVLEEPLPSNYLL
ncbi:hypothetical protein [Olivibacter sp. XZL3]|uniref:hypothetical protein n=1 Tax=Olivibacter sp. XZL3 TaxID=1735116 RepID=UPI0010666364|nr:hypothetical protein [Olivibacter sp. XZL3]